MKKLGLILVLALGACGGGGGGDSTEDFRGKYTFTSVLTNDGCNLQLGDETHPIYSLEQNKDDIVLTNLRSGQTLNGTTIGEGWIANTSLASNSCTLSFDVQYFGGIEGGLTAKGVCPGIGNCTTTYQSIVVRE